jgi:SAM-dependent methyltransferase
VRERVAFADIWAGLREQWGATFDAEVIARLTPAEVTELRECDRCGLQWFDPATPGDEQFYAVLMSQMGYEESRWEFKTVAHDLRPDDAVVDFGAGDGKFLRAIADRVGSVAGVDHNPAAIADLQAHGIEGHDSDFDTFAASHPGAFDAACTFHLLEHVDEVTPIVRAMLRCLAPGGRLYIGVPNRDRQVASERESLDCPPHHLSRWSPAQIPELARRVDAEVLRIECEPPAYHIVVGLTMARHDAWLARIPPALGRRAIRAVLLRALIGPRRYARGVTRGTWVRRGWVGLTLLAVLRLPAPG